MSKAGAVWQNGEPVVIDGPVLSSDGREGLEAFTEAFVEAIAADEAMEQTSEAA